MFALSDTDPSSIEISTNWPSPDLLLPNKASRIPLMAICDPPARSAISIRELDRFSPFFSLGDLIILHNLNNSYRDLATLHMVQFAQIQ